MRSVGMVLGVWEGFKEVCFKLSMIVHPKMRHARATRAHHAHSHMALRRHHDQRQQPLTIYVMDSGALVVAYKAKPNGLRIISTANDWRGPCIHPMQWHALLSHTGSEMLLAAADIGCAIEATPHPHANPNPAA